MAQVGTCVQLIATGRSLLVGIKSSEKKFPQSGRINVLLCLQLHMPVELASSFKQTIRVRQLSRSIKAQGHPCFCWHDDADCICILRPESVADHLGRSVDLFLNIGDKIENQRSCF